MTRRASRRHPRRGARARIVPLRAVRGARSSWLLRLIRPAWDSCERYRPVLLAEGALQDRHEELDVELLEACAAHDRGARGARCTTTWSSRATSTRSSSKAARSSPSRPARRRRRAPSRARAARGAASAARARRASRSPRRGQGRATCSRRCARDARPPSRGPGSARTAARGSSGRARAHRRTDRRAEVDVHALEVGGREHDAVQRGSTRDSGCGAPAAPGSGSA